MRTLELAALSLSSLLVLGSAASADCALVPANEMLPDANCGFETGDPIPSDWTVGFAGPGGLTRSTTTVRSGAASGDVPAQEIGSTDHRAEIDSACFPITAASNYGFGAYFRLLSGSTPDCFAQLVQYTGANCGGSEMPPISGISAFPTSAEWRLATTLPPATATTTGVSAVLHLQCRTTNLNGGFEVVMDDAFAGPGIAGADALFADGFESGDVGEWSVAAP